MNKQIIIRVVISFVFIAFSLRVLIPILYDYFKLKISGSNNLHDIDWMIKKQKDQLRSQYGISTPGAISAPVPEKNLASDISKNISKHYSYSLSENKIKNFLELADKRNFIHALSDKNKQSMENKINFFSQAIILFLLQEEIAKKTFTMSQVLARKLSMPLYEFTMGVQIKILLHMKSELRTEDQVFCEDYVLQNFSEEKTMTAFETIVHKEGNLWAQSPSLLFEELSLYFHYASIVQPMPSLRNKTDTHTAALILGCTETDSQELIKKKYKKLALEKHPDKITAQKLPPKLEKKGLLNFNRIQEAYEILNSNYDKK
jgi:hypothetical protein